MSEKKPTLLTERQQEVLELIATGLSAKEVAVKLNIQANTVRYHLDQIYKSLGVKNRLSAYLEAQRRGLLIKKVEPEVSIDV